MAKAKESDTTKSSVAVAAEPVDGLIAVLVATEKRSVWMGWIDPKTLNEKNITIKQARNCVYWSTDTRGFAGLAATGPTKHCRITKAVPEYLAKDVTSVARCTAEAVKAWESEPWNN